MRERTATIVGALVLLVLFFPLGFVVHVSPRFPGSLAGSLVGIAAALLMVAALAYPVVKRVPWLKDKVTKRVSMATLLAIHIYAGVAGPILAAAHSAHKFNSPLGIGLVATMMVVVLSGYVGRFLLARVAKGARGRAGELATLQAALAGGALPNRAKAPPITGLTRFLFERQGKSEPVTREEVALALADVEGAVRAEQAMQRLLKRWTDLHIVTGVLLTVLLVLHVWSGFYFGLRWL